VECDTVLIDDDILRDVPDKGTVIPGSSENIATTEAQINKPLHSPYPGKHP
jgi:hypothetical protein